MADKVIRYKGEFDASQILASLKSIRSEMEKGGAAPSLFKGVDKDIDKAESLVKELLAQINTGFKSTKEVDNFKKKFDTLTQTFAKARIGLNDINKVENFNKPTKALQDLEKEFEKIATAETKISQNAATAAKNLKGISTKEARAEIEKAINAGENLEAVMKRIAAAQFSKGQSSLNKIFDKAQGSDRAKAESKFTGADISKLAVDASVTKSVEGANAYKAALLSLATTSTTAEQAFADLKKTLDDEGKEYLESAEFAKAYMEDLKNLSLEAAKAGGLGTSAGAIGKAISTMGGAGAVDASGNLHMTEKESEAIQKYIDLLRQKGIISEQIAQEEANALAAAIIKQQQHAESLKNAAAQEDNLKNSTDQSTNATREQTAAQEQLDQTFGKMTNTVKQILSIGTAWRTVRRAITETYNDVKQLDKAFAEIAMVTNYSVSEMWSQYGQYQQMANKLGQSTLSVIQASGLFYQQGLDTDEALKLTEDTMKLATIAGLDFKDATSQMTAALRAFHMEMDQGAHVTDVYAEIAAHAAVDVKGLSEAMSACAAIANSAGMSFENTSAMLATMVEATQEAPKNLGTAMKTILARFTELKNNVAGTADSEFEDLDYNKVDKALKSVGVSLKDTNGQFRNMDEVLMELSSKWNTLDRNSQRYIATIAAGSRQQSRFIALMENYERTMELVEVAENSAGRSNQQFAKYQDTLEYKVNQLRNSWEKLRTSFLESDFFKGVVSTLGSLVDKFNQLEGIDIAKLAVVWLTLGKTMATNFIQGFSGIGKGISSVIARISGGEGLFGKIPGLGKVLTGASEKGLSGAIEKRNQAGKIKWDENGQVNLGGKMLDKAGLTKELGKQRGAIIGQALASSITLALTNGLTSDNPGEAAGKTMIMGMVSILPAVISTGISIGTALGAKITASFIAATAGIGAIIVGLGALTASIIAGINKAAKEKAFRSLDNQIKQLDESIENLNNDIAETNNKLKDLKEGQKTLEEIQENFVELSNKLTLTEEEQEEYNRLVEEIKENYPDIIASYNSVTNQMMIQNDLLDKKIKKLKEEQIIEARNLVNQKNLVTSYSEQKQVKTVQNNAAKKLGYTDTDEALNFIKSGKLNAMAQGKNAELKTINNNTGSDRTSESGIERGITINLDGSNVNFDEKELLNMYKQISPDEQLTELSEENQQKMLAFLQNMGEDIDANALAEAGFNEDQIENAETLRGIIVQSNKDIQDLSNHFADYYANWIEFYNNTNPEGSEGENTVRAIIAAGMSDAIDELQKSAGDAFGTLVDGAGINSKEFSQWWKNLAEGLNTTVEELETVLKDSTDVGTDFTRTGLESILKSMQEGWNTEDDWDQFYSRLSGDAKAQANFLGFDSSEFYKEFTKEGGITEEEAAYKLMELYTKKVTEIALEKMTGLEEVDDELVETITSLQQNGANLSMKEYLEEAKEFRDTMVEDYNQTAENVEKIIPIKEYEKVLDSLNNVLNDTSFVENLTTSTAQALAKNLQEGIALFPKEMEKQGIEAVKNYANAIKNSNVSQDLKEALYKYNLKDLADKDIDTIQDEIAILAEEVGGMGKEEAQAYAKSFANNLAKNGLINNAITNAIGIQSIKTKLQENVKNALKSFDDISSFITSQVEDGFLNGADKISFDEKIQEINDTLKTNLNSDDFLSIDENGNYLLDYQKLEETFTNILEDTDSYIEKSKEQVKLGEEQLRIQKAIAQGKEDELTNEQKTSQAYQQAKKAYYEWKEQQEKDNGKGFFSTEAGQEAAKKKIEELTNQIGDLHDLLEDDDAWNKFANLAKSASQKIISDVQKIKGTIGDAVSRISSLSSAYQSAISDSLDKGFVSESTITKIGDLLKEIKQNANDTNSADKLHLSDFINVDDLSLEAANLAGLIAAEIKNTRERIEKGEGINKDEQEEYLLNLLAIQKQMGLDAEQLSEKVQQTKTTEAQARREAAKATRDEAEAQDELAKATKAYQDALHGSSNYRSPLDDLYNYTTALDSLSKSADRAKEALENMMPGDDAHQLLNQYYTDAKNQIKYLSAENLVREASIANAKTTLNDQLNQELAKNGMSGVDASTLYRQVGNRYMVDLGRLNALDMNDKFKDFIANTINSMNELQKGIEDNNDTIRKRRQEALQFQKEINNKYVSLEDDMKNALKEKYQQEIDDLQAKYTAMETADNDYLTSLEEAINKQRELRERANEWDDLATKEKKLSLMQRDTSGANALEVQKLEEEVQNDRETLLDKGIDDVINNLKELYDLQKEERDLEIEYRQSLLTDAKLLAEITEALQGIHTADDLVNWYSNITDWSGKSNANIEQMKNGWRDSFSTLDVYRASSFNDIDKSLDVTSKEVVDTVKDTSETLTTKITSDLTETSKTVGEAVKAALKAMKDAEDSAASATENLTEKQKAKTEAEKAAARAATVLNKSLETMTVNFEEIFKVIDKQNAATDTNKRAEDLTKAYNDAVKSGVNSWQSAVLSSARAEGYSWNPDTNSFEYDPATVNANYYSSSPSSPPKSISTNKSTAATSKNYDDFSDAFYDVNLAMFEDINSGDHDDVYEWPLNGQTYNGQTYTFEDFKKYLKEVIDDDVPRSYVKTDKGYCIYIGNSYRDPSGWINTYKFASGGLVNYTGPAWVDGSPSAPEAFLNPEDTRRIGEAAKLLADLPALNGNVSQNISTSTVGDTTITLTVNFDSISEEYDAERVIDLMKEKIVEAAHFAGSNVILQQ